jgi:hypothetical protein
VPVRDYAWAYEPVPDVATPTGNMGTGYVTSVVSDAARWRRGEMPDFLIGPGAPGFLLPRPHWMREPGSDFATTPLAHHRDTMGNKISLSKGSVNLAGPD